MTAYHRCDTCAHCDKVRGIHPMRCQHPQLRQSLPCQVMRSHNGGCGVDAAMWQATDKRGRDADRADL